MRSLLTTISLVTISLAIGCGGTAEPSNSGAETYTLCMSWFVSHNAALAFPVDSSVPCRRTRGATGRSRGTAGEPSIPI
jgi:hypothetical protein